MNWLTDLPWTEILIILGAVISCASVIVKITPNETDNKILEIIIKVFETFSLNTNPVGKKKK